MEHTLVKQRINNVVQLREMRSKPAPILVYRDVRNVLFLFLRF